MKHTWVTWVLYVLMQILASGAGVGDGGLPSLSSCSELRYKSSNEDFLPVLGAQMELYALRWFWSRHAVSSQEIKRKTVTIVGSSRSLRYW